MTESSGRMKGEAMRAIDIEEWFEQFIRKARRESLLVMDGEFAFKFIRPGPTFKDAQLWLGKFAAHEHDPCLENALAGVQRHWDVWWERHPRATWMRILFPCQVSPKVEVYPTVPEGEVRVERGCGILICNREREFRLCGCTNIYVSPYIRIGHQGEILEFDTVYGKPFRY